MVILAVSSPPPYLPQRDRCTAAGMQLVVVPRLPELRGGRVSLDKLRGFYATQWLGSRYNPTDLQLLPGELLHRAEGPEWRWCRQPSETNPSVTVHSHLLDAAGGGGPLAGVAQP